jgi:hypothetical protein
MWAKTNVLKLYSFIPGPFQGGDFLGGIIYSSALDLKPAAINLRPALHAPHTHRHCTVEQVLEVEMGVVAAIMLLSSNKANPEPSHITPTITCQSP